ncbi:MAG TPA: hypothetical protein VJR47_00640 [Stellaceae bacterium]|nr:hypothetical protein [Stellaceae bacterium]
MAKHKRLAGKGFRGEGWHSWVIVLLAIAWCSIFYFVRQPQTPFAFDLPQAQTNALLPAQSGGSTSPWAVSNAWMSAYPTTLINCGSGGWARCSNYCDQNSLIRYTECNAP